MSGGDWSRTTLDRLVARKKATKLELEEATTALAAERNADTIAGLERARAAHGLAEGAHVRFLENLRG